MVRFSPVRGRGLGVDKAAVERLLRAEFERGYAQGRVDASDDVEQACDGLVSMPQRLRRLLVATALGRRRL